jgi:nucleoid DNA-binding protein
MERAELTSREFLDAVDKVLDEIPRKLASGELDGSGRFYTDEQLRAGAATGRNPKKPLSKKPQKKSQEPAA